MIVNYLIFPIFDPIIFSISSFSLHWYGLMYFISFIFIVWLTKKRKKKFIINCKEEKIINFLYISFISIVISGRIGYILFYNFSSFLNDPFYFFKIWNGGMSFHGGLIGEIVVILWFSYKTKCSFFKISDFFSPMIPFGLGVGRLGNFINGELWGRVAINIPWATFFPNSKKEDLILLINNPNFKKLFKQYGVLPRHPSQLYEMFFEGIVLFIILNLFVYKPRPVGSVSGLFLIFYGFFRFLIEFFRQPDVQIGFLYDSITVGQILSIPMILFGIIILVKAYF